MVTAAAMVEVGLAAGEVGAAFDRSATVEGDGQAPADVELQ